MKKGGYKLKRKFRGDNMSNDYIFNTHIMPLINNKMTTFKTISSDSLFSFVINMEFPDTISPFEDDYDSPIDTLLFKVCLIKRLGAPPNYSLEKKQPIKKHLLSEDDFKQEAFIQQKIWDQTMQFGLPDICSKLTNAVVIRGNVSESNQVAIDIINIIFKEEPFKEYMRSEIGKGVGLGIITMEPLNGMPLTEIPREKHYECYIKLLALVLRLFFVHGVIHCDLHSGNNIFNLEIGRVSALDFGRTLSVDTLVEKINIQGEALDKFERKAAKAKSEGREIPPNVEASYEKILERFEEWHMLKFCFETGRRMLSPRKVNNIKPALWFIINFELRWMEDIYFATNYSNIRALLLKLLSHQNEDTIYKDILTNYNAMTIASKSKVKSPINQQSWIKPFEPVEVRYPSKHNLDYSGSYQEFLTVGGPDATYSSESSEFNLSQTPYDTVSELPPPPSKIGSVPPTPPSKIGTPQIHNGSTFVDEEDYSNSLLESVENFENPVATHTSSTMVDEEEDFIKTGTSSTMVDEEEDFQTITTQSPIQTSRKRSADEISRIGGRGGRKSKKRAIKTKRRKNKRTKKYVKLQKGKK